MSSAYRAGMNAYDAARAEWRSQFCGRRATFDLIDAADSMRDVSDAFEGWSARPSVDIEDWAKAQQDFSDGWQHAADHV